MKLIKVASEFITPLMNGYFQKLDIGSDFDEDGFMLEYAAFVTSLSKELESFGTVGWDWAGNEEAPDFILSKYTDICVLVSVVCLTKPVICKKLLERVSALTSGFETKVGVNWGVTFDGCFDHENRDNDYHLAILPGEGVYGWSDDDGGSLSIFGFC